jgi:hypothetical protein
VNAPRKHALFRKRHDSARILQAQVIIQACARSPCTVFLDGEPVVGTSCVSAEVRLPRHCFLMHARISPSNPSHNRTRHRLSPPQNGLQALSCQRLYQMQHISATQTDMCILTRDLLNTYHVAGQSITRCRVFPAQSCRQHADTISIGGECI